MSEDFLNFIFLVLEYTSKYRACTISVQYLCLRYCCDNETYMFLNFQITYFKTGNLLQLYLPEEI